MNNKELLFLSVVVVALIGFFIFGMYHMKKMLEKEKSVMRAMLLPLLVGFILALGLLVTAFAMM